MVIRGADKEAHWRCCLTCVVAHIVCVHVHVLASACTLTQEKNYCWKLINYEHEIILKFLCFLHIIMKDFLFYFNRMHLCFVHLHVHN